MFSIESETTSKNGNSTLKLSGSASTKHASEIYTSLSNALKSYSAITVDLKDLSTGDLTLIQLLCAANKTASSDKKLSISSMHPNVIKSIQTAGFDGNMSCCHHCVSCIWPRIKFDK